MNTQELQKRLKAKELTIGIIGLGYVGLPLAMTYTQKGFTVYGFDTDYEKINKLKEGKNYIIDVDDEKLKQSITDKLFIPSDSSACLRNADCIFICVPTPITKNRVPNTDYIQSAADVVADVMSLGKIVILRSTSYPGTTEEIIENTLKSAGYVIDKDYYLAFSPERIDPGNTKWTSDNTPIVVGGVTETSGEMAEKCLQSVISNVFRASSAKVAEMEKLLENIFRSVNIALMNELAQMCDRMGDINIWEVIEAASTKPFGFMPFTPGPGIGGHCILVDPYYLAYRAKGFDFHSEFISLAAKTNEDMPHYVRDLIVRALSENGKNIQKCKVLFLGISFKKNVDDMRNSPALRIMKLLSELGNPEICYSDPYIPEISFNGTTLKSVEMDTNIINEFGCIVITTDHDLFNLDEIAKNAEVIIDTRNALNGRKVNGIYYLVGGCV